MSSLRIVGREKKTRKTRGVDESNGTQATTEYGTMDVAKSEMEKKNRAWRQINQ